MFWSIITAIETLNSARRNEFTLINVMHKSNCGVYLWKTICENDSFFELYFSYDFCKMKMKKTFLIFNWFVVYNSFRKRNQREIYIFDEKNIKREKFCVKTSCFERLKNVSAQRSNCCSQILSIEFVFRVIFFIWFLQNENGESNSAIQLLLTII